MRIDFYASLDNCFNHMAPVYRALGPDHRGKFYITESLFGHALRRCEEMGMNIDLFVLDQKILPPSQNPIATAQYGDMRTAWKNDNDRILLRMEHGVGITFGTASYADGRQGRDIAKLYLMPNKYLADKHSAVSEIPYKVIGTPKLDWLPFFNVPSDGETVCLSFHWGDKNTRPPESGSAFEHYEKSIEALSKKYKLIGHSHPLARDLHKAFFESLGIEYVEDFDNVIARSAIYCSDISSTLYEFICSGKPAIMMNAPWFRRSAKFGLRFWDYTDFGPIVEDPADLDREIGSLLHNPGQRIGARMKTTLDLYPYFGIASSMAANALIDYVEGLQ